MTKNVPGEYAHLSGYNIENQWVVDLLDDIAEAVREIVTHYGDTAGLLPEIKVYGPQDRIFRAFHEIVRRQGVSITWKWAGIDD